MGIHDHQEWLVTDGLGGFAMGRMDGLRTRRYHSLWTHALNPPLDRFTIVNGFEVGLVTDEGRRVRFIPQKYLPDCLIPTENVECLKFSSNPFPQWTFRLFDQVDLVFSIRMERGKSGVHLEWSFSEKRSDWIFWVMPLLSGRDFHSLHHENPSRNIEVTELLQVWTLKPYEDRPAFEMRSNGIFLRDPSWYRHFQYDEERSRGLDFVEDLHVPGVFQWDLGWTDRAYLEFGLSGEKFLVIDPNPKSGDEKSVDDFLVKRGEGLTMIAGYPWFGDWGRDTFISMRGMLLEGDRFEESHLILLEWAKYIDGGMIPNRFPDAGMEPEYNSVDASLWYVVVIGEFLKKWEKKIKKANRRILEQAVSTILTGYQKGTRHGIVMDYDGLIRCGESGLQLTWMDAKVGDWVVTPRIGKPVEIQALWINALEVGVRIDETWEKSLSKALKSFRKRFWNGTALNDLVDCDHVEGRVDSSVRPNMLLAVGGLPSLLLSKSQAKSLLEEVEAKLWTTAGLRSLSSEDIHYQGRYEGGVTLRDGAYHQGTVWVWWIGPMIEAWLRLNGASEASKQEAKRRFFDPLVRSLDPLDQSHFPEIADGDAPHQSRGCPFQAWSLGEVMRAKKMLQ